MFKRIYILFLLVITISLAAPQRYELATHTSLLRTAECYILKEVGNEEKLGGNRDAFIDKYFESLGLDIDASYCAAGIYWGFKQASKQTGYENPLKATAGAVAQFNYFKNNGKQTEYKVQKNDLIVWQKSRSWQGHIEFVIKPGQKGWVGTIGFNTGSNTREGDGVYKKRRHLLNPIGMLLIKGLCGFNTEETK